MEKRKDTIKTFYLAVGSCVHSALARFFTIRNPGERTLQRMLSLVDELWSKEGFRDEAEEQEWLKRTKAMLENFYKIFDCSLMPMAVELPFKAYVENLILKGRVDRIDKLADGKYRIVDYKVGDEEGISAEGTEKDLQPAFYYWGVKEGLKIEISCITYIYLQAGMAKDISISYAEMKEDLTIIKKLAERIDQETAFLPRQNIFCQDCSFQKVCNTQ